MTMTMRMTMTMKKRGAGVDQGLEVEAEPEQVAEAPVARLIPPIPRLPTLAAHLQEAGGGRDHLRIPLVTHVHARGRIRGEEATPETEATRAAEPTHEAIPEVAVTVAVSRHVLQDHAQHAHVDPHPTLDLLHRSAQGAAIPLRGHDRGRHQDRAPTRTLPPVRLLLAHVDVRAHRHDQDQGQDGDPAHRLHFVGDALHRIQGHPHQCHCVEDRARRLILALHPRVDVRFDKVLVLCNAIPVTNATLVLNERGNRARIAYCNASNMPGEQNEAALPASLVFSDRRRVVELLT